MIAFLFKLFANPLIIESRSHISSDTVDTGLPAYDRDREEMEILRRYIRRENPGTEYLCTCAKSSLDFNCHFVYDSKVKALEYYPFCDRK